MASPSHPALNIGHYRARELVSGLKKRSPFEMKNKMRQDHEARAKEKRFDLLLNSFRHISLSGQDEEGQWQATEIECGAYLADSSNYSSFDVPTGNGTEEDSMQSSNNADNWGDSSAEILPKLDLRLINFAAQGLPCPYCKENVLIQLVSNGNTNQLKCNTCGFELKTLIHLDHIKANMQIIVADHSSYSCTSGNSPNYGMFGPKAVVSCDACRFNRIIDDVPGSTTIRF